MPDETKTKDETKTVPPTDDAARAQADDARAKATAKADQDRSYDDRLKDLDKREAALARREAALDKREADAPKGARSRAHKGTVTRAGQTTEGASRRAIYESPPGAEDFATRATGELVEVPKTTDEMGPYAGLHEDAAESGGVGGFPEGRSLGTPRDARPMERVWAMDADQTFNNRHLPDTFKPDCGVKL